MVGCLLASASWLHVPLVRSWTGILVAMLVGPWVLQYARIGNVDALMLAGLAMTNSRAGLVFVGIAASLKLTPIVFALHYVAAGQPKRAAVAFVSTVGLWLPAIAFNLPAFGDAGRVIPVEYSLMKGGWVVWLVAAGVIGATVATAARRNRRYVMLACAVAAMVANPRAGFFSLGYLIVPARVYLRDRRMTERDR